MKASATSVYSAYSKKYSIYRLRKRCRERVNSGRLRTSTQSLRSTSIAPLHLLLFLLLPRSSSSKAQTWSTHLLQVASFSTPCAQIRPRLGNLSCVCSSTFLRFLSCTKRVSLRSYTLAPDVQTRILTLVRWHVLITQLPSRAGATSRRFHRFRYLRE